MNRTWTRIVAGAAFAGVVSVVGCTWPAPPPDSVPFGNAVSHNAAQHIIDPDPATARAGAPDLDGARAADAFQRYRSGTVTKPAAVETSTFGELR